MKKTIHFTSRALNGYGEWLAFNREQDALYGLELDEDTLKTLSLLDSELAKAKRWRGSIFVKPEKADSTASHSKQVMLLVQEMFDRALDADTPKEGATDALRTDAILGAWVHDMGEVVTEFTTYSQMQNLDEDTRRAYKEAKDALEDTIFRNAMRYAYACVKEGREADFTQTFEQLRSEVSAGNFTPDSMRAMQKTIEGVMHSDAELPAGLAHIEEVYDRIEAHDSMDFIRPLVKNVERIEGVRYLQRNMDDCIDPDTQRPLFVDSYEVLGCVRRSESGLPEMYTLADDAADCNASKLSEAITRYAYESSKRLFVGDAAQKVRPISTLIDTHVKAGSPIIKDGKEMILTRASNPNQLLNKRQAASLYDAALAALEKGYRPAGKSVVDLTRDLSACPELLLDALDAQQTSCARG